MNIKEPVMAIETKNYKAAIKDADGIIHYWKHNGEYDGYDHGYNC